MTVLISNNDTWKLQLMPVSVNASFLKILEIAARTKRL